MEKKILLILFIFTGFQGLFAQEKKAKDDMVFEKNVNGEIRHDFGSIVYGANGTIDFVFKNEGSNPIVISNVSSTCGCTVPTWPKEPVAPGKKGSITVVYNTKLPGSFNKTVIVYSNANNSPVRLTIMGKVNPKQEEVDPTTGQIKTVKDANGYPIDAKQNNKSGAAQGTILELGAEDPAGDATPPNKSVNAKLRGQQASGISNPAVETITTIQPPKSGAMVRDTLAMKKAQAETKKSGK